MFLLCLATLLGLMASVAAVLGIAAITRGWMLPKVRPGIARPRLYGWGVLLFAFGMCLMAIGTEVLTGTFHLLGRPAGFLALLLGSRVIRASRHPEAAALQDLAEF
ncbi:hypothetical protein GCM10010503_00270 [Streptomyces lucensis JCM 4490]|uniref:Uncharacterized protein n=2 Tax=Streptomyces lucensis TaxID=67319 RepID=A0A918MJU7_9ACTN|nr:hypothetical protein GCM10010503_00270 [Streptomyces lucensis JCM 4490]